MPTWQRRRIGQTDLHVTALGLGTATLGASRVDVTRAESEAIVRAAWQAGVRYVDTAPFYGLGAAERRVGDALRDEPRDEWVLSSKVGRLLRPDAGAAGPGGRKPPLPFAVRYDYSYDGIMRSLEDSFQRLGLARIDILYVHDIGAYQHGVEQNEVHMKALRGSGYRALEELRRAGSVRAVGIGVNEREACLEVMEFGQWDAFLLAGRYTLLEQAPLDDLIPRCREAGTTLVIGGPLNSGILAGRDTWNYHRAPPDVASRVHAIRRVCESHDVPLPAAARQFPLANPVVSAVIPGPRNVEEFEVNLGLLRHPIPAALWSDLKSAGLLHPDAPVPAGGDSSFVTTDDPLQEPS